MDILKKVLICFFAQCIIKENGGGGSTNFIVSKEYDGVLLRTFLKNEISLSRAMVSALKREQGMRVNGETVTVRYVLKENDVVSVDLEDKEKSEKILPVNIPLSVIYEDDEIVVVDKPPFMPVHPSFGHYFDTLANALQYKYRDRNFVMRAVNRLDRNTSGLVLVAKNRRAASILSAQMKNRQIGKKYFALVEGDAPEQFLIEAYMKRKQESVIERCICSSKDDGAEYSSTEGRKIKTTDEALGERSAGEKYSLLELIPHTGRTHQLRVHLSFMGFPIVGDELYGAKAPTEKLKEKLEEHFAEIEYDFKNDYTAPTDANSQNITNTLTDINTQSITNALTDINTQSITNTLTDSNAQNFENSLTDDNKLEIQRFSDVQNDTFHMRHLLHCGWLEFYHPETKEKISFESKPDFF